MSVLVTGASGQLGCALCRELRVRGIEYLGVSSKELDITNREATQKALRIYNPNSVIHCASYTKVDLAELEPGKCWAVNADGTRNLAEACREIGAKMLYISTDYVFPGKGEQFYKPDDDVRPLNVYGTTKLAGELAVRSLLTEYFIVRISWLFSENGNNFVKTMLRLASTQAELKVVSDQIGSPTYAADLVPLLYEILQSKKYGIYHVTNEGVCSWAEFADEIFRLAGCKARVQPILTKEYHTLATRPLNSRLSKAALDTSGFFRLSDWHDGLNRCLRKMLKQD